MGRILLAVALALTSCSSVAVTADDSAAPSTSDAENAPSDVTIPTTQDVPTTEEGSTRFTSGMFECPTPEMESTISDYGIAPEPTSADNTAAGVAAWFMSAANSDWQVRRDWQRLTLDADRSSGNTFIYVDPQGHPYLRLTAQQISGSWVVGDMSSCAPLLEDLALLDDDFVPIPNGEGYLPFHSLFDCGGNLASMEFLWELPPVDGNFHEMLPAIEPFLDSEEGQSLQPLSGWRVAHADEDSDALPLATLVAKNGDGFTWMNLAMIDRQWTWAGSSSGGDCELHIVLDDHNTVNWEVLESSPDSSIVRVRATEQECVGGQEMGDRLRAPVVTFTPDLAYVLLSADPPPGDLQTCPSNPSVAIEIDLGENLGNREIRNTQTSMGWFSAFWPDQ